MLPRFNIPDNGDHRFEWDLLMTCKRAALGAIAVILLWLSAQPAAALGPQSNHVDDKPSVTSSEKKPEVLDEVGVVEHLGDDVPLDVLLFDEQGDAVRLAQFFDAGKPVVLNLGYFGCPKLCGLVTNGVLDAARDIDLKLGDDYRILTVSIDPTEAHQLAAVQKQSYLDALGEPGAGSGWHFLTGERPQIQKLTDAVGFEFEWDPKFEVYAHAAVIMVITPDGRVSRYLYGHEFHPKTFRLSLVEASNNQIGSTVDRLLLYCFKYDASLGAYTATATTIMRGAGLLTALALGVVIAALLIRERLRGASPHAATVEGHA